MALIKPAGARDDYRDLWGADDLPFFSRYDGLMHLRVNALGAYCLDITTTYTPAPATCSRSVTVQVPGRSRAV